MKHLNQFFALVATAIISISSLNATIKTWTGATSTTWSTGSNWSGNTAPTSSDTVVIPSSVSSNRNPVIGGSVTIRRFVMNGLTVTFSGTRTFTTSGDIVINAGTFTASDDVTCNNFTINGGSFILTANDLIVNNNLIVNNGLLNGASRNIDADNVDLNNGEIRIQGNNLSHNNLFTLDGGLLTNTSTSTLDLNSDFTFLSGTIDMNGENMNIQGLYYFTDGSIQDPGTLITTRSLEIDYVGTHTLGISVRITTGMTFTSGILESSNTYLVIFDYNATISGVSNTSHISGPVRKEISSSNVTPSFTFPIGNGSYYAPIGISSYGNRRNADFFTATYFDVANSNASGSVGTGLNLVSKEEYWILDRGASSGTATTTAVVTLSYNTSRSGPITNAALLKVARWNGSNWDDHGRASGSSTSNTSGNVISSAAVSSFSPFTLGSSTNVNPLPVSLLNFNAAAVASNVNVKWTTTSEINNDFFSVEKSLNGTEWISIGKVKGAGNTESLTNYNFVDANPVAGIQYYRLKQTDVNGEFTYSSIAPVNFSANTTAHLNIFPMPASNFINVELPGASEMTVAIYNSNGQKVFESTSGSLLNIDIQDFNAGLYIVEVKADNNVLSSKFLKN